MIFCSLAACGIAFGAFMLGLGRPAFYAACLGFAAALLLLGLVRGLITRASVTAVLYRDPPGEPSPGLRPGGDHIRNR